MRAIKFVLFKEINNKHNKGKENLQIIYDLNSNYFTQKNFLLTIYPIIYHHDFILFILIKIFLTMLYYESIVGNKTKLLLMTIEKAWIIS